jgi:DnaD/phage-associated family protein
MLDYLQLYPETLALIKRYPKEQRYDLIEAQMEYACDGKEPVWPEDDTKWLIWEALKLQVDRTVKKVEQNKANAKRSRANASEPERNEAKLSEAERKEAKPSEPEPTPADRITTNYELRTMKDIDDDATACAREDTPFGSVKVDPVIVAVQSELNGLTISHYDDLAAFRKDLPDELVIEAINEAVAHGARTWAYVRSILQGYIRDSIKTVGQARQRSERRKREGPPGKKVTAQQYAQRDYTEDELEARITQL